MKSKSIVYILITLIISSIMISALPKSEIKNKQTISIQCVEKDYDPDKLVESADIIKSRLNDYGIRGMDVKIDKTTSSIDVSINDQDGLSDVTSLIISKGKIEFYEVHDRLEVIKGLGTNKELVLLLNIDDKPFDRFSGIFGYCKENRKSEVELYLKKHYVSKTGYGINFYWSERPDKDGNHYLYLLNHQSILDNSAISKSAVKNYSLDTDPELMIAFDKTVKSKWKDITKRNINKAIAIVLDKKVLQAPIVKSEIDGGKCIISGNFSPDEITRFHSMINNKELPLDFEIKN